MKCFLSTFRFAAFFGYFFVSISFGFILQIKPFRHEGEGNRSFIDACSTEPFPFPICHPIPGGRGTDVFNRSVHFPFYSPALRDTTETVPSCAVNNSYFLEFAFSDLSVWEPSPNWYHTNRHPGHIYRGPLPDPLFMTLMLIETTSSTSGWHPAGRSVGRSVGRSEMVWPQTSFPFLCLCLLVFRCEKVLMFPPGSLPQAPGRGR